MMEPDAATAWPSRVRTREFVEMVRSRSPSQYVCFEYHDGGTELTTKALQTAIQWLAEQIHVLLAVDLDHSVVIASGALSVMDDAMADQIVDGGLAGFFWEMSKAYPDRVAMVRIDRKGNVTFDPAFHFV
jgi:hypothetical protein